MSRSEWRVQEQESLSKRLEVPLKDLYIRLVSSLTDILRFSIHKLIALT